VNIWRGIPFYAISFLAGMQTIPHELYEAAIVDGASAWHRFWRITLPLLRHVITIVLLLSIILTLADFQIVYVLTRGGPANSTHLFATYAFQLAVPSTELGLGAAVSMYMFPVLALVVFFTLLSLRKED
jgi:multiple sugar transport system permease protein